MKMTTVAKMPTNVGVSNNNNNNFGMKENGLMAPSQKQPVPTQHHPQHQQPQQQPQQQQIFYGGYNTHTPGSEAVHTNSGSGSCNVATTANNNNASHIKQCSGCGVKIIDRFLLHAMDKYWHTGCLKCSCCQSHLGEIGTTCFTRNGMILCKNDYLRLFGHTGTCAGCNQSIPAQEFVMKAQSYVYHVNCFSCVVCHCKLMRGDRFSIYQGQLLCEHDFPKVVRGTIQLPAKVTNKVC